MDKVTFKILSDLDFGYKILSHMDIYGYDNNKEFYLKLKEMKEEGLIVYTQCTHELFKGDPQEIFITNKGKGFLEQNKQLIK